jgi:tRNA(Ile)-lysidine synthase
VSGVRVPAPPPHLPIRKRLRRLEPAVRRALRGPCRMESGEKLLVAASGGADSTALLLALHSLAAEHRIDLYAAHLNHGLRGAAADADQRFVASLCARLGIPLVAARWDARARLRRRGLSGEKGLRVLRREFLTAAAKRVGAGAIATAHTADDQLETMLLRLARGTGLRGLGAMRPRAGAWIKPLLAATRRDVEADLRRIGQDWRHDASNDDLAYARNRVRHVVVPQLLALGRRGRGPQPGGAQARASAGTASLARRAAALAAEIRSAERALVRSARELAAPVGPAASVSWNAASLRHLPLATRFALYRRAWRTLAGRPPALTREHLCQLDRLARAGRGTLALPGGYRANLADGLVLVARGGIQQGRSPRRTATPDRATSLRVPGSAECAGFSLVGRWTTGRVARGRISELPGSEEYFAAEGLRGALEVRQARADDVFVPFGRTRSIPLGEFLSKLPVRHRTSVPSVLADASGILWVIGVRRSARAPVQPSSRRVLCVHLERHD